MSQDTLRTALVSETGTSNALGDKQLVADVAADKCVAWPLWLLFPLVALNTKWMLSLPSAT